MMARQLGLAAPQPGQVIHPNARLDSSAPVEARLAAPVSARSNEEQLLASSL